MQKLSIIPIFPLWWVIVFCWLSYFIQLTRKIRLQYLLSAKKWNGFSSLSFKPSEWIWSKQRKMRKEKKWKREKNRRRDVKSPGESKIKNSFRGIIKLRFPVRGRKQGESRDNCVQRKSAALNVERSRNGQMQCIEINNFKINLRSVSASIWLSLTLIDLTWQDDERHTLLPNYILFPSHTKLLWAAFNRKLQQKCILFVCRLMKCLLSFHNHCLSDWVYLGIFCFPLLCVGVCRMLKIGSDSVAILFAIFCEVLHVMFVNKTWAFSSDAFGMHHSRLQMAKFVATVGFSKYLYISFHTSIVDLKSLERPRTAPLFITNLLFNAFAVPSDSKSMRRIIMSYSVNLISFM